MNITSVCSFFEDEKYQQARYELMEKIKNSKKEIENDEHLKKLGSFLSETVRNTNFRSLGYKSLQEKQEVFILLLNQLAVTGRQCNSKEIRGTAKEFGNSIMGMLFAKEPDNKYMDIYLMEVMAYAYIQKIKIKYKCIMEDNKSEIILDDTKLERHLTNWKEGYNCFISPLVPHLIKQIDELVKHRVRLEGNCLPLAHDYKDNKKQYSQEEIEEKKTVKQSYEYCIKQLKKIFTTYPEYKDKLDAQNINEFRKKLQKCKKELEQRNKKEEQKILKRVIKLQRIVNNKKIQSIFGGDSNE